MPSTKLLVCLPRWSMCSTLSLRVSGMILRIYSPFSSLFSVGVRSLLARDFHSLFVISLTFFSFQLKNYFYLSSKSILQILRSRLVPGFFRLTASHKKTIVFVMNVAYWLNTVEARHGALSSDCDRCSWVETIFDLINLLNSICLQLCSFIICVASQVVQGTMITASDL